MTPPNVGTPAIVRLSIDFDPRTGDVQVTGPLLNKGICYGMLELARDKIANYEPPPVLPVSNGIIRGIVP